MSCHVYRNVRLAMLRHFTVAFPGGFSALDQQQQIGIAFSPRRSRHSAQELGLDAARDASNLASREKVDVVGLDKAESGNSKESVTEKVEV